ncbi:transporter substrate-binding domain-containing protein [Salicola sp. Rm-C-2C1-2]|uniref:substrate-binding periplasmic protein n=1 Tax=Salicola sp. Rm-C-2C1-2 TaxID=3141321 RepID=UPI0032E38C9C
MPAQGALRILLTAVVWNLVLIARLSAAQEQSAVLKGAYIEFPPLTYTNEQGAPAGLHIETTNRLAQKAGYKIDWRSLPIDRIFLYLQKGNLDVWLGAQDVPMLAEWTREPGFSFGQIRLNAYHKETTEPVSAIPDLRGKHLIMIRGYTYLDRLDDVVEAAETQVDHASTHRAGLRMLQADRGDYLLDFEAPVTQALETLSLPAITDSPLTGWNTTLVFSKRADHSEDAIIRDFESAWSDNPHSLRR